MGGLRRSVCGGLVATLSLLLGAKILTQGPNSPATPPHPGVPSAPPANEVPLFLECAMEKRAKALRNCGSRCDVVLVGDSITEGLTSEFCYWNARNTSECGPTYCPLKDDEGGRAFRESFKHHAKSLIIAGAGDETQHVLAVLDAVLPVLKAPKVYSVLIGTNNIPKYSLPGNISWVLLGVTSVVMRLRAEHPSAKVLLHAVLPRADDSPGGFSSGVPYINRPWLQRISELNQALAAWAQPQAPAVEFVDCSGAFPQPHEGLREFMPDLLHPNGAGYRRWFKCWEGVADLALS